MVFFKRLLGWLMLAPIALLALALAVANRTPVAVTWNPLVVGDKSTTLEIPLFAIAFSTFALGVIAGGLVVWMAQGRWRRATKQQRVEIRRLTSEITELRPDSSAVMPR